LNQGTIAADVAGATISLMGVTNGGAIVALNGGNISTSFFGFSFNVNNFNNLPSGAITISGGGNLTLTSNFTNSGTINISAGTAGGGNLILGSNATPWHNFGTINGTNI